MHRAKSFAYISASIFLLALAYHLGAGTAQSQTTGVIDVANVGYHATSAVIGRVFYFQGSEASPPTSAGLPPIPGTAAVIACGIPEGSALPTVVLANGEVWRGGGSQGPGPWELVTTYPIGTTPTKTSTFGSVKARYR